MKGYRDISKPAFKSISNHSPRIFFSSEVLIWSFFQRVPTNFKISSLVFTRNLLSRKFVYLPEYQKLCATFLTTALNSENVDFESPIPIPRRSVFRRKVPKSRPTLRFQNPIFNSPLRANIPDPSCRGLSLRTCVVDLHVASLIFLSQLKRLKPLRRRELAIETGQFRSVGKPGLRNCVADCAQDS